MKNIYWLLLLATSLVRAQLPAAPGSVNRQASLDIAQYEKQHAQRLGEAGEAGTAAAFTIASDNFDVNFYRCTWQLDPEVRYINGAITSYFTIKTPADSIVFDLVNILTVDSVIYHSNKISFHQSADNGLIIKWPATIGAGQKDSVSIFYQGIPVTYGFGNFFQGLHRGNYAIWTLSEPYGAAGWWPCKNGLNDKADSLDIIVTIPEIYTPSSNGVLISKTNMNGNSTSYFKHRYPIATYLIALAIGKYNVAKDSVLLGDRQMPVFMYTLVVTNPDAYKPAIALAKDCLQKFSSLFGLYPFYKEQYCQTQWGLGGGMEHQTNSYIVDTWPNLVAHELGHQWFGDKVTCGSWQDLWLNEGMATLVETMYYELYEPAGFYPKLSSIIKSVTSLPDGSVWASDTTSFTRLFSGRLTYNKGSMVARMLRWKLGDSTFFKALRTYVDDPVVKYGYARTADMKRVMEKVSGRNLETFFTKWIYGEGYPSYQLTWSQNTNNWTKVKLSQTTSHASVSFYDMPVAIQFKSATRDTIIVLDHQFSGQQFTVDLGFKADTAIIDPQLWLLSDNNTSLKESTNQAVNQLKIYPNPAPDHLYVSLLNPTDNKLSLQLFNSIGQLVYQQEISMSGNNELLNIPVQHLARGIYYLKLKSNSINTTRRIMR